MFVKSDIREVSIEDLKRKTSLNVLQVEGTLPPFERTCDDKYASLSHYPPLLMPDDSIYYGQLNSSYMKHGYGIIIKSDGSKYEGYWDNDIQTGPGRFFDSKGNYYTGNIYLLRNVERWQSERIWNACYR